MTTTDYLLIAFIIEITIQTFLLMRYYDKSLKIQEQSLCLSRVRMAEDQEQRKKLKSVESAYLEGYKRGKEDAISE